MEWRHVGITGRSSWLAYGSGTSMTSLRMLACYTAGAVCLSSGPLRLGHDTKAKA